MNVATPCTRCGESTDAEGGLCPRCSGAPTDTQTIRVGLTTIVARAADWERADVHMHQRFGDYELIEEIARGGMGVVYKARQLSLNRIVAVKMILHGRFNSPEFVQRFRAEARAAANLHHPNIVAIYDIGEAEGQPYFSMEYIAGRDLGSLVRQQPLPARRAAEYVKTIAAAIHHAHQHGILHRDLKPSNVLIDAEGELRVMDFGLAKRISETDVAIHDPASADLTMSGQVLGSPNYMSPEQAAGKSRTVTVRSDVYSLGAIFYHLVTGRPPFMADNVEATLLQVLQVEAPPPRLLNPSVPRDIETICLKCLEKDPAKRYGSALAVAEELGRFLEGEPLLARPVSRVEKIWRWCKRRPMTASLGAATAGLVLSIAIGSPIAALRIEHARRESVQNAAESKERLRRINVATGVSAMEAGDMLGALPWLINALRLEPPGSEFDRLARIRLSSVLAQAPRLIQFWSLRETIRSVEFSATGQQIVVLAENDRAFLLSRSNAWTMHALGGAEGKVFRATFSPDGRQLAFASRSNQVQLLNARTLESVATIDFPPRLRDLRFTPDGRQLFVASTDGSVQALDALTGARVGAAWKASERPQRLVFNRDGSRLLVLAEDRAWLHEPLTGAVLMPPIMHRGTITDAKFSLEGRIVTSSRDGTARISSITNSPAGNSPGWAAIILPHADDVWVTSADFSPDGQRVATATDSQLAHIWDARTGTQATPPLNHLHSIWRIRFSADGQRVVTASFDQTARLWDAHSGQPVSSALRHNGYVADAAFSPDGTQVLTAGQDGVLRLWEIGGLLLQWKTEMPAAVRVTAFSPDDALAAVGCQDGTTALWERRTGKLVGEGKQEREISAVAFSPVGGVFASASRDGTLVLRSVTDAEPVLPPFHTGRGIRTIAFDPRGEKIVTGGDEGAAQLWGTSDGLPIGSPLIHTGAIRTVAFSPDGTKVATGGEDHIAQVWEAATGAAFGPALVHDEQVMRVVFSPDGKKLATAVSDLSFAARAAHLWDVATGRELVPPMRHTDGVGCLSFSPDGRRLASGSEDGTAYIWDTATGQRLTQPMRHEYHVYAVQFVQEGRALFTAGNDGAARLWDARTGEPLTPRLIYARQRSTAAVSTDGAHILWGGSLGRVYLYSFPAELRTVETLTSLAELLTGRRLDFEAGLMPASLEAMEAAWQIHRPR